MPPHQGLDRRVRLSGQLRSYRLTIGSTYPVILLFPRGLCRERIVEVA